MIAPDFAAFSEGYEAGRNQILWTRLPADLDTPVSLMLKLAEAQPFSFVLESVTGGEVRGRYSIVGMRPDLIWECRGTTSRVNRAARWDPGAWEEAGEPLAAIRSLLEESRIDLPDGLPAACAGLFGYLGYDMIRLVEHLPDVNPDVLDLPDAMLMRPSVVAVLDGVRGEVILVVPAWAGSGGTARAAYAQAAERLQDALSALSRAAAETRDMGEPFELSEPVCNFPRPLPRDGRGGEGADPRRRHLPGRPVATFRPSASTCRRNRSPCIASLRRRSTQVAIHVLLARLRAASRSSAPASPRSDRPAVVKGDTVIDPARSPARGKRGAQRPPTTSRLAVELTRAIPRSGPST